MSASWAKMPCSWQTQRNFHQLVNSSNRGEAIAALKLYITFCLKANYSSNNSFEESGCVQKSITDLCKLIGLSRPMVVKGLRLLKSLDLIKTKIGRPSIYQINNYEDARYWTKLPKSYLFEFSGEQKVKKLILLSNRSSASLHALQLYLYLASIRDRSSNKAKVAYPKISEVLGISRNEISRAISLLISNDLITVRREDDTLQENIHSSNIYALKGSITEEKAANLEAVSSQ